MPDIGSKQEKLRVGEKYFYLFNSLLDIISKNPDIRICDLKRKLLETGYKEEIITESIYYLISRNFIIITTNNREFERNKIQLNKKPELYLIEKKESKYPMLVISLPPYNLFGLESELKHSGVQFSNMKDEIMKIFKNAKKSIYICSPFLQFNGIKNFLPILILKAKSGVDIKIISRQIGMADHHSRYSEIREIYRKFKNENANVTIRNYHYQSKRIDSSTHAKLIVCDHQYAYLGSGELRFQSFEKNFELGIILKGELAHQLGIIFEKLFSISMEVNFDGG